MAVYESDGSPVLRFDIDIECNNCGRFDSATNVPLKTNVGRRIMCKGCHTGQDICVNPEMEIGELATWGRRYQPTPLNITVGMVRVA